MLKVALCSLLVWRPDYIHPNPDFAGAWWFHMYPGKWYLGEILQHLDK
jgi:hypothetical protein